MLSLEDLAELGDRLHHAGFRIAMQQYFDAEKVLLRLAAAGALPAERARLEPYLAPVFCTSPIEQQRFGDVYGQWARPGSPRPDPSPSPQPLPRRRIRLGPLAIKLAAAAALIVAGLALWQHNRPRVMEGLVVSEDGKPVADAEVRFGRLSATTNASGQFRVRVSASQLPSIVVAKAGGARGSAIVGPDLSGDALSWRRLRAWLARLYWYGTDRSTTVAVTLTLPAAEAIRDAMDSGTMVSPAIRLRELEFMTAGRLDVAAAIGAPTFWQRVDGRNISLVLLPLLLFGAWALSRLFRRPVLRRIASRTPAEVREVHFAGGVRALLPGLPLRRLAQELRRRRLIASNELQPELTIAATLRRAGVFTPVRGSRVEPEYLALVDRASVSDHQGLLADHILADLARSDVLIERYDFDGNADQCRLREAFDASARRAPAVLAWRRDALQTVALAELRERHPEHRVLVFGDGAGCFDGFTGAPAAWLETLLEWPSPVLITPLPPERWSRREWALEQLGVTVLPLSQSGMLALMSRLGGAPSLERGKEVEQRGEALHDRSPSRWLERRSPDAATVEALCSGLRAELGERGFAWVAGCAAYPETHWGITLRLAAALVPDRTEVERLLPRVASLPWFREAFMPDWLRKALLARMNVDDEDRARGVIRAMLESVTLKGGELPLRIAIDAPPAEKRLWRRLREWWRHLVARDRVGQMLNTAPPDSPMRDLVFLQFVNGERIGGLSLRAPGALLRTLVARQRRMVSKPLAAFVGSVSLAILVAWWWPPAYLGRVESTPILLKWERGGSLIVMSAVQSVDKDRLLQLPKITWSQPGVSEARAIDYFPARLLPKPDSAALSPDGRILAVGHENGRVATVAVDSKSARSFASRDQSENVDRLAFSDDSRLLAAASGKTIAIWDLETGTASAQIEARNTVTSLAFAPGGRLLAAGSDEGTVRLWRVGEFSDPAAELIQGGESQRAIDALSFTADGRTLAAGDDGGRVTIWDVNARRIVREFSSTPGSGIRQLAFQPTGNLLAAMDSRGVRLLQPRSGAQTPPLPGVRTTDFHDPGWLAFSADGQRLATFNESGGITLYRVSAVPQAPPPASTAGPAPPSTSALPSAPKAPPPPAARPGRSLALLAGNDYPGTPQRLQGSVSGTREVAQVLQRRGFDTRLLLEGTRAQLLSALDQLLDSATAEDRVLIYLSGHTTLNTAGEYAFLAASPGIREQARQEAQVRQEIQPEEIFRRLLATPAKEVLLVANASNARQLAAGRSSGPAPARVGVRKLLSSGEPAFPLALSKALLEGPPDLTASALLDATARRMPKPTDVSLERLPAAGDDADGEFRFGDPGKAQRRPATKN